MKDIPLGQRMLLRAKQAEYRVKKEFSKLTPQQLNWKPSPEKWSIGQCLDHLIKADTSYFPAFEQITNKTYRMTGWEKWSPFSFLLGPILASQLKEKVKIKLTSPKVFTPPPGDVDPAIVERFQKHLNILVEYLYIFINMDMDRPRITSPASKYVTYSVRYALLIIVPHLHRHINQAIRIKSNRDFPK